MLNATSSEAGPKLRLTRLLLVCLGILLGQFTLYGPSLLGGRILLPLDILTGPGVYLPLDAAAPRPTIENVYLSDLVYVFEPARRFAHSEIAAGRFPQWIPWQFAGAPLASPWLSPFLLLQYCVSSPIILAWAQAALALVAGLGMFAFCHRALRLSFWPCALAGWAYPLTGFFVFWQGYPTALPVCWLPWLLLALDAVVEQRHRLAAVWVAVLTGLTLVSGSLDVAGQVLVSSFLFTAFRLVQRHWKPSQTRVAARQIASITAAWLVGLALAAPYVLPLLEYTRTGTRMERRGAGEEERPPFGLGALPQCVLPDMYGQYGIMKTGSFRYSGDSQQESTAAAYVGLVTTMFLAPLAFADRTRRAPAGFFAGTALLSLSWPLGLPGFVQLLRWPGLNLFSHNRWVFLAAFSFLALAAIGLEAIQTRSVVWKRWMWLPLGVAAGLCLFCGYRASFLPEPIATELEAVLQQGKQAGWIRNVESVRAVQAAFTGQYAVGAVLSMAAVGGWLLVRSRLEPLARAFPVVGAVVLADLLWFAHGRSVQADPALYYPRLPAAQAILAGAPGRVIGYQCLPANLAGAAGMKDVRGYDAVDPAALIDLLTLAADSNSARHSYALSQWLAPRYSLETNGTVRLPPVLDLLGVRYVIFRGAPPAAARPLYQGQDYWVGLNPAALPRVFVPRRVTPILDRTARLAAMAANDFNPRETAIVEIPGVSVEGCEGTAEILAETPTRLNVVARLRTEGLLLLADRWDPGWKATVGGRPAQILRVDHALRGVRLPAGESDVEFVYAPRSRARGLNLAGIAVGALLVWGTVLSRSKLSPGSATAAAP